MVTKNYRSVMVNAPSENISVLNSQSKFDSWYKVD